MISCPRIRMILTSCILLAAPFHAPSLADGDPLAFARHLFDREDYYRAITEFERVRFENPDSPEAEMATLGIGDSYARAGMHEQAMREYEELALRAPQESEAGRQALLRLMAVHYARRSFGAVISTGERYLERHPNAPEQAGVLALMASSHQRLGEEEEAGLRLEAMRGLPLPPAKVGEFASALDEGREIPRKSIRLAGGLSAVLPGAGQAYADRWTDALLAFSINAAFIYGAYESYDRGEEAFATFLVLMETIWYTGNIYNAMNSAAKFNRHAEDTFYDNLHVRFGILPNTFDPSSPLPAVGFGIAF